MILKIDGIDYWIVDCDRLVYKYTRAFARYREWQIYFHRIYSLFKYNIIRDIFYCNLFSSKIIIDRNFYR